MEKYWNTFTQDMEKIHSMYAKETATRDFETYMRELYDKGIWAVPLEASRTRA